MNSAEEVDRKEREEKSLAEKRKYGVVFPMNSEAISNVSPLNELKEDDARDSPSDLRG